MIATILVGCCSFVVDTKNDIGKEETFVFNGNKKGFSRGINE